MTHYFEQIVSDLRAKTVADQQLHHFFLLGTGVNFTERPIIAQSYPRGETLSYVALLTSHLYQEKATQHADASNAGSAHYAHGYHSSSVDVINGTDTPGFEVGDRLAKTLMLALAAVATGKTALCVSGFSRGGVAAIVLMHELKRIRDGLRADLKIQNPAQARSLASIIADSHSVPSAMTPASLRNPSYTRSALNTLIPNKLAEKDDKVLKEKLLVQLEQLQVKLFVLDPVPGGNIGVVGPLTLLPIGWQEDSFYNLPDFVIKKQALIQQHETSNCFKPIIPIDMPFEIIPGCHGTGDGNPCADNGLPVPEHFVKRDLTGVQDLVVRRWLEFMFPDRMPHVAINLGHAALDAVSVAYLRANKSARSKQLLDNYKAIQENFLAFEWLSTQNYAYLRRHMSERRVHYHQRGNTSIEDLNAHGDGKNFLNLQHVELWMAKTLEDSKFSEKSLAEQVNWLKTNIQSAFKATEVKGEGPQETVVKSLIANPAHHDLLRGALSLMINTITQTYMRHDLSKQEQSECMNCVQTTLQTLDEAALLPSLTAVHKKLALSIKKTIHLDLTQTMLRHQNSLLSLAQDLLLDAENIDPAGAEEGKLNWLLSVQKLYEELSLMITQIDGLEPYCDQDLLVHAWGKFLPVFAFEPEEPAGLGLLKKSLLRYIQRQQKLLQLSAGDVLSTMPDALEHKPAELEWLFYNFIHRQANVHNLELSIYVLTEQLTQKCQAEKRLKCFRTPEQEAALAKVQLLLNNSNSYLTHLQLSSTGTQLLDLKKNLVQGVIAVLKDCEQLPTLRLQLVQTKLTSSPELLKGRQDPSWQQFFHDCMHTVTPPFAGMGRGQMTSSDMPGFFKPVEERARIASYTFRAP
ncbi:MAG: hypothetical protein ACHP65_06155 [Legionellales bacterium]